MSERGRAAGRSSGAAAAWAGLGGRVAPESLLSPTRWHWEPCDAVPVPVAVPQHSPACPHPIPAQRDPCPALHPGPPGSWGDTGTRDSHVSRAKAHPQPARWTRNTWTLCQHSSAGSKTAQHRAASSANPKHSPAPATGKKINQEINALPPPRPSSYVSPSLAIMKPCAELLCTWVCEMGGGWSLSVQQEPWVT